MTVRLKLALTIFATGAGDGAARRRDRRLLRSSASSTRPRTGAAMAFLGRVVSMYDNIFDMHEQDPEEFQRWLRSLVLFEPDTSSICSTPPA